MSRGGHKTAHAGRSIDDVRQVGAPPRSSPIEEWTIADRAAWERAISPGLRLRKGGPGAHLAPITQKDLARRYGYFVDHLRRNGLFDPDAPAAGQVNPERIASFIREPQGRAGSVTVLCRRCRAGPPNAGIRLVSR